MHIRLLSIPMCLKLVDLVSRCFVAYELDKNHFTGIYKVLVPDTIKNNFLALDIKKWRIVLTIAAYKSDDL